MQHVSSTLPDGGVVSYVAGASLIGIGRGKPLIDTERIREDTKKQCGGGVREGKGSAYAHGGYRGVSACFHVGDGPHLWQPPLSNSLQHQPSYHQV